MKKIKVAIIEDVQFITISPIIEMTATNMIIFTAKGVCLIKLLSSMLLKNVACTSTPGYTPS